MSRIAATRRAVLLSSYGTGAANGKNLGTSGYSHDLVAELFRPLLARWGRVVPVSATADAIAIAAEAARAHGEEPIHVSVIPLQDMCLSDCVRNVAIPAWEFPDVPDHSFDENDQNNWPATADRCSLVIVSGPFTEQALRRGGARVPIRKAPVPIPDEYFQIPDWTPHRETMLRCRHYSLPDPSTGRIAAVQRQSRSIRQIARAAGRGARQLYRTTLRPVIGPRLANAIHAGCTAAYAAGKRGSVAFIPQSELRLSGIVYTSIFNPQDGRKNWLDLLTGFLKALGHRSDVTLVVKLVTSNHDAVDRFLNWYQERTLPHMCRVVVINDYLSEQQLLELAQASTFYIQATRAEGNCLPLMNYLAAGRPGISPRHSALSDYFDDRVGFVVESHPEPAAWPHDPQLCLRTTWARIVWPSLVDQIRTSFQWAHEKPAPLQELAARGRAHMRDWAAVESVWPRLRDALDFAISVPHADPDARRQAALRAAA